MLECFDQDFWHMTAGFMAIVAAGIVGFMFMDYMSQHPDVVEAAGQALLELFN